MEATTLQHSHKTMPSNPAPCSCGGQMFKAVWSVYAKDDSGNKDETKEPDPHEGTVLRQDGFECVECGEVQLTRKIPERHAKDSSLEYPESADRDMVTEQ